MNGGIAEVFLDLTAEDDNLAAKAARLLTGQAVVTDDSTDEGGERA